MAKVIIRSLSISSSSRPSAVALGVKFFGSLSSACTPGYIGKSFGSAEIMCRVRPVLVGGVAVSCSSFVGGLTLSQMHGRLLSVFASAIIVGIVTANGFGSSGPIEGGK